MVLGDFSVVDMHYFIHGFSQLHIKHFWSENIRGEKAGYELGQVFLLNLWRLAFSIQVDGEQKTLYLFSVSLKTESHHTGRSQIGSERGDTVTECIVVIICDK